MVELKLRVHNVQIISIEMMNEGEVSLRSDLVFHIQVAKQ